MSHTVHRQFHIVLVDPLLTVSFQEPGKAHLFPFK